MMKQKKRGRFILLIFLMLLGWLFSEQAFVQAKRTVTKRDQSEEIQADKSPVPDGRNTILFGSVVKILNKNSNRYLADLNKNYKTGSRQSAVAAVPKNTELDTHLWVIKGPNGGDRFNCSMTQPVKEGDTIRLENLVSGRNLHAQTGVLSPHSRRGEVSTLGNGDANDNWVVRDIGRASDGVLNDRALMRLEHANTHQSLHISPGKKVFNNPDFQEVVTTPKHGVHDKFIVELALHPGEYPATRAQWEQDRGATLNYNTLVWIDPVDTASRRVTGVKNNTHESFGYHTFANHKNDKRLWTRAASRRDLYGKASEPESHLEVLAGPWSDVHVHGAAGFYSCENADDASKTGPINYGDRVRIRAHFSIFGKAEKEGILDPFKYWWMDVSHEGAAFNEVVISHPENDAVIQGLKSSFVLEPVVKGFVGEIHQNDPLCIRSLASDPGILWVNNVSRWGDRYGELLAGTKKDEFGREKFHNERQNIWHRLRIHHVNRSRLNKDDQEDYDEINTLLGAHAEHYTGTAKRSKSAHMRKDPVKTAKLHAQKKLDEAAALEFDKLRNPHLPRGFEKIKGRALDIAVGMRQNPVNGTLKMMDESWMIDLEGNLSRARQGDQSLNPWVSLIARDDQARKLRDFKSISVGADGTVYAITLHGIVYRYRWPEWNSMESDFAKRVGSWQRINTHGLKFSKVAVGNHNDIWFITESNEIYQFDQKHLTQKGVGIDVAVGKDGTVVGINAKDEVYQFDRKTQSWNRIPDIALSTIAVGSKDNMWGTFKNEQGIWEPYQFSGTRWRRVKDNQDDPYKGIVKFSVNGDGSVYALTIHDTLLRYYMEHKNMAQQTESLRKKVRKKLRKFLHMKNNVEPSNTTRKTKVQGRTQAH